MKTYLKVVNPIVALIVLLLCIWAGLRDMDGDFAPKAIYLANINIYFLAKGLFCSSTLFILGIVASHLLGYGRSEELESSKTMEEA
jgi:hypothetical protein